MDLSTKSFEFVGKICQRHYPSNRATSATLFDADADADADADDDVNADNADTDNPDLSVTLMMAELRPLHSQTVSLLLLRLKLVLPVM